MVTRNEKDQLEKNVFTPSKQPRPNALLFSGARVGTALLALALFVNPKLPPYLGE